MNETEQKILELKAAIFDIIRKQDLYQGEINKLQQVKQQYIQELLEFEKELKDSEIKNPEMM